MKRYDCVKRKADREEKERKRLKGGKQVVNKKGKSAKKTVSSGTAWGILEKKSGV